MKKRILSLVLAALMIISVLPAYALADNEPLAPTDATAEPTTAVSEQTTDGSVHVNKSISADGTTLTLEAYLTNKVIQTVSTKPLDIVLVLDQSGSMAYDFKGNSTNKDKDRRQYAMKQAVKTFIEKVKEQYSDQGNHQMAIVTFADNAKQLIGWTAVDNKGKSALINAIDRLPGNPPEGTTNVGAGMQKAQKLMNSKTDANRQKIVIVFTDGVPTSSNYFDTKVANAAINAAKAMKDAGTIVYTVGIFNGANPSEMYGASGFHPNSNGTVGSKWEEENWGLFPSTDFPKADRPAGNRFLNLVSNNYPSADSIGLRRETIGWGVLHSGISYTVTKNFKRAAEGNYYLTATDSISLTNMFQQIVNEISTLEVEAGTSTILSDTLSQYFALDIPANTEAKNAITAKKWDCINKDTSGNYTWKEADSQPPLNVEVTEEKTIKVTGFDYTKNAVTETEMGGNTTYSGSKLVVTIPIKPDTSYSDWKQDEHYYDTNDTGENKAGLSYGENQKLELTESPKAPVTGYKVEYEFTGDAPTGVNKPTDNKVYITGQKVTAEPLSQATVIDETGTWTFKGWKPEGEQTFETSNITFTGEWTFKEADKPDLSVTKTAKLLNEDGTTSDLPEKVAVGDKIQYTVKVKNTGNVALADIKVEDTFTGAGTLKGITYNATTQKYEYTIDSLAVNEEETITYTYVVVAEDAGTRITNNVVATSGNTTDDGGTVITVDSQYGVTYRYVDTDNNEITDADVLATKPTDNRKFNDNDTVAPMNPTSTEVTVSNGKWTFDKWDEDSKTVSGDNVTFTGTWTFEAAEQPKYTLSYEFVSGTPGKMLPAMTNPNSVQLEEGAALTVPTVDPTTVDDQANNGSWTFKGWYLDEELNNPVQDTDKMPAAAKTIYGKWEFAKTVQPPQTEYKIELPISKELRLRSGSHPGERTFLFDVSYESGNVFRHAGGFSITLQNGWDHINETVTVTVDEDAYYAILEGARVRVVERDLGENGFEYDTTPRFGRFGYIIITDSGIVGNNVPGEIAPLPINPDDSNFNFVNYYGKSGKVEKPAKVSPQLNRDDHVAYIMGYPDGNVRPEGEITRAEACTIFFRLLTKESRDYYFSRTNDYTDVSRTDWFNNAISMLSNAGIVTGYADGTFRPDQPITRGEMAKIIANFARLGGATKSFTDLSGHWAKSYVELAAGNGWIAGYPDGTFGPDKKITRAETVTMINRVLERVPAKESRLLSRSVMLTFPDNEPGEWYYIAVQEASNSHTYQRSAYETAGDEMWLRLIENVDWTKLEK